MTSIKLRKLQNKPLKITLKDDLDNDILNLEFDKPNISLKSFLNHLDLKLYPLKRWTFENQENSDYILFTYHNMKPIWITHEFIHFLSILELLEIFNYKLSNNLKIIIKNGNSDISKHKKSDIYKFLFSPLLSNDDIRINYNNLYLEYNYLLYFNLYLEQINNNNFKKSVKLTSLIDTSLIDTFLNNDTFLINAIMRGLLILTNSYILNKILTLDQERRNNIILLALETHPDILQDIIKISETISSGVGAGVDAGVDADVDADVGAGVGAGVDTDEYVDENSINLSDQHITSAKDLIKLILDDKHNFMKAIKYFPDNIKHFKHSKFYDNRDFLRFSIIKYNCPYIKYINIITIPDFLTLELILLSIKINYTNIKYITNSIMDKYIKPTNKTTELYNTFIESFIKINGYNFQLIKIIYPKLFKDDDAIQTCLDKKLGKHIIKFINKIIINKSFKLKLNFIRNNCYKDMIKKGITFNDKNLNNLINILLNEGFIDEALDILKNENSSLTEEHILLIIRTNQIDKIRKLDDIKNINNLSLIDYDKIKNILIEIIENGLLSDLIKMSVINSTRFIKFLEDNNLIHKLDKFTIRKMTMKTLEEILKT